MKPITIFMMCAVAMLGQMFWEDKNAIGEFRGQYT